MVLFYLIRKVIIITNTSLGIGVFVGRKLARYLHNTGKNFYDLDQRTINEYKIYFFD